MLFPMKLIVNWLLSAIALLIVAHVVPGFYVTGLTGALWAAAVIGLINATLGLLVKLITLPLTVLTLGLFWLIINAIMLEIASVFAPGFRIAGFWAAFWGAIVLSLVNMILRWLVWPERDRD
jgi:putative membrane protein